MSGKTIAVTIGVVAAIGIGVVVIATSTPPPIIIGDSSVVVSHDSITKKSSTEIEVYRWLRKVRSINVSHGSLPYEATEHVEDAEWNLIGAKGTVRVDHIPNSLGGKKVVVTCPSGWQGTGTYYVCSGEKFTPATLTFTDNNHTCSNGAKSCELKCTSTSGYCGLELEYK